LHIVPCSPMGRLSVNWVISKQRELEEYAKTITDLLTHGKIRSRKHAEVLEELFLQEQITIFRKQLPFYTQLLARWRGGLNADINGQAFCPKSYSQQWSVNSEKKITLLVDLISMLTNEASDEDDLFIRSLRQKELQLLSLVSSEDGLLMTDTPILFFPLPGKTYDELLQEYIEQVGLVYFQEEYSRIFKLLYYKIIRDLRGALRKIIRLMARQNDDETDKIGYKNQDEKTIFKTFFIVNKWNGQKLFNKSGTICSPIKYPPLPGRHLNKLAS
jgi:hypothetical protein